MSFEVDESKFTGLLHELGVDAAGLSFGWLLEDEENCVLRWFYKNIGTDNVFPSIEKRRYSGLLEAGQISHENVHDELSKILFDYDGLVSPTDTTGLTALENEITILKEKLELISKQQSQLNFSDIQVTNAKTKENQQLRRLQQEQLVISVEASAAFKECMELAKNVENKKNELVLVVHNTLDFYGNSLVDKAISDQLLTCGPVEKYLQNRQLFFSYVDIYTKRFALEDLKSDQKSHNLSRELENLDQMLFKIISDYVNTKVTCAGRELQLKINPNSCNTTQLALDIIECQKVNASLQEEVKYLGNQFLERQLYGFVNEQCASLWQAEGKRQLAQRNSVYSGLCILMKNLQEMVNLDELLYFGMKRNCMMVEDAIQFALDVKDYMEDEKTKSRLRVDYMRSIQAEHLPLEIPAGECNNPIAKMIKQMNGIKAEEKIPVPQLMKLILGRQKQIELLQKDIQSHYSNIKDKEMRMKKSSEYVQKFIWDGYTRQPNLFNLSVLIFIEDVKNQKVIVDKMVRRDMVKKFLKQKEALSPSSMLWIWFLTNEKKLLQILEEAKRNNPEYRPFK